MMRRYLWICLIIYFNRICYYNHYKNYALLSLNFDKNRRNSTLCGDLDRRRRYVSEVIFFHRELYSVTPAAFRHIVNKNSFSIHTDGQTDGGKESEIKIAFYLVYYSVLSPKFIGMHGK